MISIIIPLYNASEWMHRSVESVLQQTFSDWELVLVDDGSKDDTLVKCEEYCSVDKRIYVIHQENAGVTAARKSGFLHSKGEYVCFLDADDALQPKTLELLYSYAKSHDADVVKGTEQIIGGKGVYLHENRVTGVLDGDQYMDAVYFTKLLNTLHASIYRCELLTDEIFSIDKRYKLGEDIAMNVLIANRVKRAYVSNDLIYDYYYNEASAMQTQVMSYEYNKEIGDFIYNSVERKTAAIIESHKEENRLPKMLCRFFFVPEIPFSEERYSQLMEYLKDGRIREKFESRVEKKYRRFVMCKPLFKVYSWIFRMLYLMSHLKGRKRKIIY